MELSAFAVPSGRVCQGGDRIPAPWGKDAALRFAGGAQGRVSVPLGPGPAALACRGLGAAGEHPQGPGGCDQSL